MKLLPMCFALFAPPNKPLYWNCERIRPNDRGRIARIKGVTVAVPDRRKPLNADPLEPMQMGSGTRKAATVNLLVNFNPQRRDTVSKQTAATSTIEITSSTPVLMLALELGEEKWKLGFCSAFGQVPLERNIASRNRKSLLTQIAWAKKKLGLPCDVRVVSCYEAGREGFWLHRFLVDQGIESLIVDSSSIEVPQKSRRAKTDRLDMAGLCDLLARHVAGSAKKVWSVIRVPTIAEEDRRHLLPL